MKNTYQQKTDAFFYDNYCRTWKGADPDEMPAIYIAEMDNLLYRLENGYAYNQEFACDYPLAQRLRVLTDGKYQAVKKENNPYSILPAQNIILFRKSEEVVYQCSYQKFYQIMEFYIQQLMEKFPMATRGKEWLPRLNKLKKGRWKEKLLSFSEKIRFWDTSVGNPDSHFEGSKKLELHGGDIASFQQLQCQDTLTSLVAEGLYKVKDIDALGEYTQLKVLHLRDMGVKDIGFISSLKNLQEVGLRTNQITDISPLEGLNQLEHLYLAGNPIKDFSVIAKLPALKKLFVDFEQLPDQIAWDSIPKQVSLTVVQLTPLEKFQYNADTIYTRTAPQAEQKQPEKNQEDKNKKEVPERPKDPRRLDIKDRWLYSGLTNSLGYQPSVRYDITKLKHLDCSNHIYLCDDYLFLTEQGDYSCLEYAVNLKTLNLSNRVVNDFSWLKKCVNLKEIDLSGTDFSDLELLSDMKQLTSLNLKDCNFLKADSFSVLKNFPKLKRLNLSNTDKVIEFFCQQIAAKGFCLSKEGTGKLPQPLEQYALWGVTEWIEFLQQIASCVSEDKKIWFLTEQDYHLHPEVNFLWEDWEMLSNEADGYAEYDEYDEADEYNEDDEYDEEIEKNPYRKVLPIMVSLTGEQAEYYGLSLPDKKVVCWKGDAVDKASVIANSFLQFLIEWPETL